MDGWNGNNIFTQCSTCYKAEIKFSKRMIIGNVKALRVPSPECEMCRKAKIKMITCKRGNVTLCNVSITK